MAELAPLEVKVVTKIRGLWKLAVLDFLLRHLSAKHVVHVHLADARGRQRCVYPSQTPAPERPAAPSSEGPGFSLTGH